MDLFQIRKTLQDFLEENNSGERIATISCLLMHSLATCDRLLFFVAVIWERLELWSCSNPFDDLKDDQQNLNVW